MDIKTVIVLRDVEVIGMLREGEVVRAVQTLGSWQLVEPERFAGEYIIDADAEVVYSLAEVKAWLAAQWERAVPIERVYAWRANGRFPNARVVPAHGHAGRRWYVPEGDLVAFAQSHRYRAKASPRTAV